MLWLLMAFLSLVTACMMADWNRHYKRDPLMLNFWRSLFCIAYLFPFSFFVDWPSDEIFYAVAAVIGICSAISIIVIFGLAKDFNGRVASISKSISLVMTYVAWILIDESSRSHFMNNPYESLLSLLLIFIALNALYKMKGSSPLMGQKGSSMQGYVFPSVFIASVSTFTTILGKTFLPQDISNDLALQVFVLAYVIFICQFIYSAAAICVKRRYGYAEDFSPKKYIVPSVLYLALLGPISCVTTWAAIALSPNPAYVNAIVMSAPVFLLAYHRIKDIKDEANPLAGTVLAVSVILLALLG